MNYDTLIVTPLRDMTSQVLGFIPTLFIGLGVLIVGWIIARWIRTLLNKVFTDTGFDKLSDKVGASAFLSNGGIKQKPGELISCLIYCVLMVMVLILSIKAFGLTIASGVIDKMLAYVPSVLSGLLILIIGMYLARFVSVLVYVAAKNTDMPVPATLSRLTKLAIMVYVTILFLTEIGFVALFAGPHYTIFITGIVFALALAFGLAGRDVASRYLTVFKKTVE